MSKARLSLSLLLYFFLPKKNITVRFLPSRDTSIRFVLLGPIPPLGKTAASNAREKKSPAIIARPLSHCPTSFSSPTGHKPFLVPASRRHCRPAPAVRFIAGPRFSPTPTSPDDPALLDPVAVPSFVGPPPCKSVLLPWGSIA